MLFYSWKPLSSAPRTACYITTPVRRSHRSQDRLVPRHLGCLIRRSLWKRTMSRPMEELRGYFAVHSQGLDHATRAVALARRLLERRRDLYLLFLAGSPALDLLVANGFDAPTLAPLSRFVEGPANFWASRIARKAELVLAAESAPDWPNVRRIGPIVRGFSASREKLREDFVFRKKTILVTVGGTAVGEFLIREAVR